MPMTKVGATYSSGTAMAVPVFGLNNTFSFKKRARKMLIDIAVRNDWS